MELDWNYHTCCHQRWCVKYELRSTRPKLVQLYSEGDLPVDLLTHMPKCYVHPRPQDVYTEGGWWYRSATCLAKFEHTLHFMQCIIEVCSFL